MKTTNLLKKKPSTINTVPEKKNMQFLITKPFHKGCKYAQFGVYYMCTKHITLNNIQFNFSPKPRKFW